MAAAYFNYSKEEFYALTPFEFSVLMIEKNNYDNDRFEFIRNELRTANYFSVITSMSDYSSIKSPQDLYKIPSDNNKQSSSVDLKNLTVDKFHSMARQLFNN